jgi:putative oxidoreductase
MTLNTDLALLILRLVMGSLLVGHGAQKLFGWFGGSGFTSIKAFMESLGLRPAAGWAFVGGMAEFAGGALILLGFLGPLGPIAVICDMVVAIATVHWGKPIWVTEGGAEFPLTNIAIALALIFAGVGRYSLDGVLGLAIPLWITELAIAAGVVAILVGLVSRASLVPAPARAAENRVEWDRTRHAVWSTLKGACTQWRAWLPR